MLLHTERMPDFVSSPANCCHLLLSFVGYFDVFPYKNVVVYFFLGNDLYQNIYILYFQYYFQKAFTLLIMQLMICM